MLLPNHLQTLRVKLGKLADGSAGVIEKVGAADKVDSFGQQAQGFSIALHDFFGRDRVAAFAHPVLHTAYVYSGRFRGDEIEVHTVAVRGGKAQ